MRTHATLKVAAFLGLVLVGSCRSSEHPTPSGPPVVRIRIPDTRFMGFLPLYLADEKKLFEREGVQIEWIDVRDPGQAERLFHAAKADILITTFANLLPAELKVPGTLKWVMPMYESSSSPGSFILAPPDSPMRSVRDLEGKVLGTYSGPSQLAYARMVLERLGLRNVRLVQVSSAAQVQSLFGKVFDALFTVEPYASTAIEKGAKVIEAGVRTRHISNPFWVGAVAFRAGFLAEHPDTPARLLRAVDEAISYIEAHDRESRDILLRRTSIDEGAARRSALYTWVAYPTASDLSQIQSHADLLTRAGVLVGSISVASTALPVTKR